MRREENLELIKKIAATSTDTSQLRSSKYLGIAKDTKRQVLAKALEDSQAGLDTSDNRDLLYVQHSLNNGPLRKSDTVPTASSMSSIVPEQLIHPALVGGGLKRPLEFGDDGMPLIKKRPRMSPMRKSTEVEVELAWEGFSSHSVSSSSSHGENSDNSSVRIQTDSESQNDSDEESDSSQDSESSETSGERSQDEAQQLNRKERSSAFKAWATQQVNEALGFTPSGITPSDYGQKDRGVAQVKPRAPEADPLPPELQTWVKDPGRKVFSVLVKRSPEVEKSRLELPVVAEEQKIMEAIHSNPTVVICGATGSGKTTQIPQFLYETGYGSPDSPNPGMIGITQPRRVAAVSMAKRVSYELGSAADKVSYQIRFDSTVSEKTAIKYMTDGILIREIANDFALTKYSAIVIDEAHERSTNTDILIGMVSRIVDLRASMSQTNPVITPLKFIIMSATLRISDFTNNANLFRGGPPPVVQAEGRQYPVTVHFARQTRRDYLEEMFIKVSRGHKKLPPGGVLVFLTGQNEITALAKRLNHSLSNRQTYQSGPRVRVAASEAPLETEDLEMGHDQIYGDDDDGSESFSDDQESDHGEFDIGEDSSAASDIYVLPLYSQLPTREQLRVFETPPENTRLIVLATNVAETSLTIPGIRYVFDCGRSKEKKYDEITGVQSFSVGWISRANATQRSGRAGRTSPGHTYRLYSSAIFERDFPENAAPEILRMPVEDVVLHLKSMNLQNILTFPFPTPPSLQSLTRAEKLLTYLGAISADGRVTDIGSNLIIYPLSVRFSKMALLGDQHGCMPYTIAMIAALVVSELFTPENLLDLTVPDRQAEDIYTNAARIEDTAREQRKREFNKAHHLFSKRDKTSDAIKLLSALCAYAYAEEDPEAFCTSMFLRAKALKEASQLRQQLSSIVRLNRPGVLGPYQPLLPQPSDKQLKALRQILVAGFIDQVAIRADLAPNPPEISRKPKRAIEVPYLTLFPSHVGKAEDLDDKAVYLHPSSVLAHLPPKDLPQYVVYSHLQQSSPSVINSTKKPKVRMHALTPVSGNVLATLTRGTPLLGYSKPIGKVGAREGGGGIESRRECIVMASLVGEKGGNGAWPLRAMKVVQRKGERGEWEVEKVVG